MLEDGIIAEGGEGQQKATEHTNLIRESAHGQEQSSNIAIIFVKTFILFDFETHKRRG